MQNDALKEVVNIGVGQAANTLNTILDTHVDLSVPELKIVDKGRVMDELESLTGTSLAGVILRFEGTLPGQAALLFPPDSAVNLVNLLVPDEYYHDTDLDAMRGEALTEIGNIVINAVMGHFSNFLKLNLDYSLPDFRFESNIFDIFNLHQVEGSFAIILAKTHFVVAEHSISGDILLFFGIESMENLIQILEKIINNER